MRVEAETLPPAPARRLLRDLIVGCCEAARGSGAGAREVVFASSGGVGEGVVCVVDELEFAGAGGALGGVGGDAVGVCFEGGAFVGVADLLGGCG